MECLQSQAPLQLRVKGIFGVGPEHWALRSPGEPHVQLALTTTAIFLPLPPGLPFFAFIVFIFAATYM